MAANLWSSLLLSNTDVLNRSVVRKLKGFLVRLSAAQRQQYFADWSRVHTWVTGEDAPLFSSSFLVQDYPTAFEVFNARVKLQKIQKDFEFSLSQVGTGIVDFPFFSKIDQRLWKGGKKRNDFVTFGEKWGCLLTWYKFRLPEEMKSLLSILLKVRVADEVELMKYLGHVSDEIKARHPEELSRALRYLIDLKVLGGYDTELNRVDPVKAWFKSMTREGDYDAKQSPLHPYIRRVVNEFGFKSLGAKSVNSWFLDRGNWMRPGASDWKPYEYEWQGKKQKLKNKTVSGLILEDDELLKRIWDPVSHGKVFQKLDEPAKARAIVNFSMNSFVRCSLLSECVERFPEFTLLEKSGKETLEMHDTVVKLLRTGRYVALSLDFSAWDKSVGGGLVLCAVQQLFENIKKSNLFVEGLSELCDVEFAALRDAEFTGGDMKIEGLPALPSGHRWTSFLNTIINRAVWLYCKEKLELGGKSWHVGDDIAVVVHGSTNSGRRAVEQMSKMVEALGFNLNPHKTVISTLGLEFLRQWISVDGVFGYPGRLSRSFVWNKPVSDSERVGWLQRIRELVNGINQGMNWGLVGFGTYQWHRIMSIAPKAIWGDKDGRRKLISWVCGVGKFGGLNSLVGDRRDQRPWVPVESGVGPKFKSGLTGARGWFLDRYMENAVPLGGVIRELVWEKAPRRMSCFFGSRQSGVPSPRPSTSEGVGWWERSFVFDSTMAKGVVPEKRYLNKNWRAGRFVNKFKIVKLFTGGGVSGDASVGFGLDEALSMRESFRPYLNYLNYSLAVGSIKDTTGYVVKYPLACIPI